MRGLLGSGLILALGWAVTAATAQESVWRPVGQGASPPVAGNGVSLRRPVPLEESGSPAPAGVVLPVSFSTAPGSAPLAFTRAKIDQPPQPMPVGPSLTGAPVKGEPIGPPAGLARPPAAAPGASEGVVSRWIDDGAALHGEGPVTMFHEGPDGFVGGDMCCPGDGCLTGDCGPGCPIGDCCPCDGGCCPGCPPGSWGCDNGCCQSMGRVWASAEYLMWWIKNGQAPPLVSASPAGTPLGSAGVLGSNSMVLFPANGQIDYNMFSGGRFTLGFSLPSAPCLGFESTYFFLGTRRVNYLAGGTGDQLEISRPVNNVNTGLEEGQVVAFPGKATGTVAVYSASRLWGVEGNTRYRMCCGCNYRVDLLAGFRFLELDEDLNVTENLQLTDPTTRGPTGTRILVYDSFNTKNSFYGGQVGVDGEYRWRKFFVGGSFKLGMGVMHQEVNINGATVFIVPGLMPTSLRGGVLAAPSNIGHYSSNKFAVLPELGLKVGYQVTDHIRVFAGYTFLYASSVVRPGDQIDRVINRTQLPTVFGPGTLVGSARPMPMFVSRDFWAQGVNFGLEFRY